MDLSYYAMLVHESSRLTFYRLRTLTRTHFHVMKILSATVCHSVIKKGKIPKEKLVGIYFKTYGPQPN